MNRQRFIRGFALTCVLEFNYASGQVEEFVNRLIFSNVGSNEWCTAHSRISPAGVPVGETGMPGTEDHPVFPLSVTIRFGNYKINSAGSH
jgi:hypothetical protein